MNGKEFLRDVRSARDTIKALQSKSEEIESSLTGKAVTYDGTHVQSGAHDMMFEKLPEVVDLQKQIENEIRKLAKKESIALNLIERMDKWSYRAVMVYYYLQGMTLEATAERMGKSYTWICTTIRKAEDDFEKVWELYRSEH